MKAKLLIAAVLVAILAAPTSANWAPGDAPFINTWLVLGTFDNQKGAGMRTDLIVEATVQPRAGEQVAGKTWQFFDDRIFSRNYDDYQDLFSYFFLGNRITFGVFYPLANLIHRFVFKLFAVIGNIRCSNQG